MDSEKASLTLEKLRDDNFHVWKHRVQLILGFKELDEYIDQDPPALDASEYPAWRKGDRKAMGIIGLSLSDDHLEQFQHAETAKEMWTLICEIYEKHTLLNKLAARRRFYTATMNDGEKVLSFAGRIRQLAATLKSMGVTIDDQEMAMALLNGLPERFDSLISALDALGNDDKLFTFNFVKSRCVQEEQRHAQREKDAFAKSETAALIASRLAKEVCKHCGRHRDSSKCFLKYPHLAPPNHPARNRAKALIGQLQPSSEENPNTCLVGVPRDTCEKREFCLNASVLNNSLPHDSHKWVIDSGCSSHLTYDRSAFVNYKSFSPTILDLGADSTAQIVGQGDINIEVQVKGKLRNCTIKNVKHVPSLRYQLLSVSCMAKLGVKTMFDSSGASLVRSYDGHLLATGSVTPNGLYLLDAGPPKTSTDTALLASLGLWHRRLAHVNTAGIKSMADHGVVKGIRYKPTPLSDCVGCILGKSHRSPIPKSSPSRASRVLELVHSDVLGPVEVPSVGGARYIITFIDDYSNWTVGYTMRNKSESLARFKDYKAYAERHTNQALERLQVNEYRSTGDDSTDPMKLKILRSDNGGEYLSNEFKHYLCENGIKHELTVAYTPQQNGVAERMNRTLFDLVRSMIHFKRVDKRFWAEAFATAVYVRNRVTSRALPPNTTPYHFWHGKAPDLSHTRVFGSECWYVVPRKKVKKLDARAREATMMGYSSQSKGYKLWDIESKKFVVSRDVTFKEEDKDIHIEGEISAAPKDSAKTSTTADTPTTPPRDVANDEASLLDNESDDDYEDVHTDNHEQSTSTLHEQPSETRLRRSSRVSRPPTEWWKGTPSSSLQAERNTSTSNETSLLAADVPSSYSDATSSTNIDFWAPGIKKEHDSILENNTFALVERKPGMNVIPCRYVFRVKNGEPKVRIVAKGFRQVHGVDFGDTYAPVVSLTAVRCFLATTAHFDLECDQMDVVTAFLNGDLKEDIYMEVPAGLKDPNRPSLVCKLQKALYGLKQAPRQWYAKINSFLVDSLRFTSSPYEPCLYYKHSADSITLIVLYVDDLLIAGNDRSVVDQVKDEFKDRFKMKDLGVASEFLGIQIYRDRPNRTLHVTQSSYIDKVLERFRMADAKPVSTPMEVSSSKISSATSDLQELAQDVPYRQAIGSLMYLMIGTRPDIGYAVGKLSQYCEKPLKSHWSSVKRVLRYIKGTRNVGIQYDGRESMKPIGYCDSDWAGCLETRKSTEGTVFLLAGGAVFWSSKKQSVIATSSCEAEYIATCSATKTAIWLSNMLNGILGTTSHSPITVHVDNQGCIGMAHNESINARNKHIDIRYHFVRHAVKNNQVILLHCPGTDQPADPLTKPLGRIKFKELCDKIGLKESNM